LSAEKSFSSSFIFQVFLFAAAWVLLSSAFSGILIYSWAKARVEGYIAETGKSATGEREQSLPAGDGSRPGRMLSDVLREAAVYHVFAVASAQAAGIGLVVFLIRRCRSFRLDSPEISRLRGLFPICSHCNRIRESGDLWRHIESYIQMNSRARFSHCICPDCAERHYSQFDLYNSKLPRAS
jgi:hypothetical protein